MSENKFQELGDALKDLYGDGLPERSLVVICDDDESVIRSTTRVARDVLARAGIRVDVWAFTSASDGGVFLTDGENRKRVALLLTDNDAPQKGAGLSLVARLRAELNEIQIPAAVMSGYVDVNGKTGVRRLNPVADGLELSGQLDCLIPKPFVSDNSLEELAVYLIEAVRSRIALMALLELPPKLPKPAVGHGLMALAAPVAGLDPDTVSSEPPKSGKDV